jgi:hypothetical protein
MSSTICVFDALTSISYLFGSSLIPNWNSISNNPVHTYWLNGSSSDGMSVTTFVILKLFPVLLE